MTEIGCPVEAEANEMRDKLALFKSFFNDGISMFRDMVLRFSLRPIIRFNVRILDGNSDYVILTIFTLYPAPAISIC